VVRKVTEEQHSALGEELRRVRADARIRSQEELAKLSGVSRQTIKLAELGRSRPKADTLLLLARGAATDTAGEVHEDLMDAYFRRLMRAAGYLTDEDDRSGDAPRPLTYAELRRELIRLTGRRDVTFAFADVFSNYKKLGPAHQQALEAAAMAAMESLRMQQEAEEARRGHGDESE
jgi:transcriptional regulator with XRE-family HTH domain